jgi:hypothetical protein
MCRSSQLVIAVAELFEKAYDSPAFAKIGKRLSWVAIAPSPRGRRHQGLLATVLHLVQEW